MARITLAWTGTYLSLFALGCSSSSTGASPLDGGPTRDASFMHATSTSSSVATTTTSAPSGNTSHDSTPRQSSETSERAVDTTDTTDDETETTTTSATTTPRSTTTSHSSSRATIVPFDAGVDAGPLILPPLVKSSAARTPPTSVPMSQQLGAIQANNTFALALYAQVRSGQDSSNVIMSPSARTSRSRWRTRARSARPRRRWPRR
jgi:hypothetical protein